MSQAELVYQFFLYIKRRRRVRELILYRVLIPKVILLNVPLLPTVNTRG